jgi:sugar phosphate isomerase/epimerase
MNQLPSITLGHLTVERLAPPDVVSQAAAAGFTATGLRFWDGFTDVESYPLRPGSPMLKEVMTRLRSLDIKVIEIENIVLRPDTKVEIYRPIFEVGAMLGSKRVIVGSVVDDEALGTDIFAALCEVAAPHGLDIALEFYLKWHGCASLPQGIRIVSNAAQPNGKLLVDALHLTRSGAMPADLATVPPAMLASLQLCDASARKPVDLDDISQESRFSRLLPGQGGLPLAAILAAYPQGLPIGIEIPNRNLEDQIGSQQYLNWCFQSTASFLARHSPEVRGADAPKAVSKAGA